MDYIHTYGSQRLDENTTFTVDTSMHRKKNKI